MPRGVHMKEKWADPAFRATRAAVVAENGRKSADKRSKPKIDIECETCGQHFFVNAYRAEHNRPRWCSKDCMVVWQRTQTGPKSPKWQGGTKRHSRGYVLECCPEHPRADRSGYVLQHILVVERHLGHPIPTGYEVHHKDEVRDNNILSNLEVLTPKEHRSRHILQRDPATGRLLSR